jgi:hypothetical protein
LRDAGAARLGLSPTSRGKGAPSTHGSRAEIAEFAEFATGRAFDTAGLRPAPGRWRDPHIQAAVTGAPFVCADLSTSCRAKRDVSNARTSASSASSARDQSQPSRQPQSTSRERFPGVRSGGERRPRSAAARAADTTIRTYPHSESGAGSRSSQSRSAVNALPRWLTLDFVAVSSSASVQPNGG